jgi:ATP-binding cassette subfamily B protein
MRDGQIVEQGSHEQLLASGGAYAELYAAQFSGAAIDVDTGEAPAPDLAGAKV